MLSPNHTQVSNTFIDEYMSKLSPASVKVFLAISRKTIGWHKETDRISQSQLVGMTGMSKNSVKKGVAELEFNGLIIVTRTGKGKGIETIFELNYVSNNDSQENNGSKNDTKKDSNVSNYDIKDVPNGSRIDTTKETSLKETKLKKQRPFSPPSFDDIETYCKEKGYNVDPDKFFDYYHDNDWYDKHGNKVKCWKGRLRTWNKRDQKFKDDYKDHDDRIIDEIGRDK